MGSTQAAQCIGQHYRVPAYRPAPARGQHSVSASSWAAQGKSVLVFIYVMFKSTFRAKEIAFSSQIVLSRLHTMKLFCSRVAMVVLSNENSCVFLLNWQAISREMGYSIYSLTLFQQLCPPTVFPCSLMDHMTYLKTPS